MNNIHYICTNTKYEKNERINSNYLPRFYTLLLNFYTINRGFLSQFFLGFILFFVSFFAKANAQQPSFISNSQKAVIYVADGAEIFGEIDAEIIIIKQKTNVGVEPKKKSETASKILSVVKKQQVSAKVKEEIANIKLNLDYKFSLPFHQKYRFTSPCKHQVFVVQEIQLLKFFGLKSAEIFAKIIIHPSPKRLSSYFQFSIISKHYYAYYFTRPPPEGLII